MSSASPSSWVDPAANHRNPPLGWIIGFCVLAAIAVRLPYVLAAGFPINDGGLFYVFVEAILGNGFALPETITWSGEEIPFGYPPLAFYLYGAIHSVTGIDLLTLFLWLPMLTNLGCVAAFVLVARRLVSRRLALLAGVVLYALNRDAFEWMIMGGGATRSLGCLFCLLAFHRLQLFPRGALLDRILFGVFGALTFLTHLEWTMVLVSSSLLYIALSAERWRWLKVSALCGVAAFAVTAPWWFTVLANHGLEPFMNARSTVNARSEQFTSVLNQKLFYYADYLFWPLVVGMIGQIWQRKFFLSLWFVLIYIVLPRNSPSVMPLATSLLAGVGIQAAWAWIGDWVRSSRFRETWWHWTQRVYGLPRVLLPVILIAMVVAMTLGKTTESFYLTRSMRADELELMRAVKQVTPEDAKFVVFFNSEGFHDDFVAEWFPAITDRACLSLAQGHEWTGKMKSRMKKIQAIKTAQFSSPLSAITVAQGAFPEHDHVFVMGMPGMEDFFPFDLKRTGYQVLVHTEAGIIARRVAFPKSAQASGSDPRE